MNEKIYIIEQICCRGQQETNKYSFDREMFFKLLDLFTEDSVEDGELSEELINKIREISGKDDWELEELLYGLLVGCADFYDTGSTLQQRIQSIKDGKYCAELEESAIAVGFSTKEAKANLVELEDEDDW